MNLGRILMQVDIKYKKRTYFTAIYTFEKEYRLLIKKAKLSIKNGFKGIDKDSIKYYMEDVYISLAQKNLLIKHISIQAY